MQMITIDSRHSGLVRIAHEIEIGARRPAGRRPGIAPRDQRPDFRRRGLARKLLSTLAAECVERGYSRLQWAVLNWNVNAIALYDEVGGKPQTEWTTYRVSGPELTALAQG